jgi:DNA-directed RNA polymerase specialized sigma24 family protein
MNNFPDNGIFTDLIRKKDYRLRLWISIADFQLKIRTRGEFLRFYSGHDVVFEIISAVLTNRVKWDMERVPNVHTFMINQIRSRISNIVKKERGRISAPEDSPFLIFVDADEVCDESADVFYTQDLQEFRKAILQELTDDVIACFVYEELMLGYQNQEIAARLGLSITDVQNAKKRILRVIKRISRLAD